LNHFSAELQEKNEKILRDQNEQLHILTMKLEILENARGTIDANQLEYYDSEMKKLRENQNTLIAAYETHEYLKTVT
jgi:hypothetical protein